MSNVIVTAFGKSPYRNLDALRDAIWDYIHEHTDQVSLAETLGVLDIVKYELLESAKHE